MDRASHGPVFFGQNEQKLGIKYLLQIYHSMPKKFA